VGRASPGHDGGGIRHLARRPGRADRADPGERGDHEGGRRPANGRRAAGRRRVNEILDAKATPEEAAAFRQWILQAAQASADAAKEGGFMGIGATRVSEGEKAMIAKLGEVLGVESA
jgi:hypothetical protein